MAKLYVLLGWFMGAVLLENAYSLFSSHKM